MVEITWSIRAYEHLFEIARYIEKDSPFQAKRVVQLITKETQRLKSNVRIGKMIQELRLDKYRELRIFNYRIMYKLISEDKIAILGIVHSKRIFRSDLID
ncbi:MAG TPA: type II toxin-antitoxin system RelE/ParE family toxin [Chitinispirillaceae bacterium]|nr:type II toxin-antitoxin system RelE/ParE family toxin [Chitinispirillaceae bacterium]